GPRARDDARRGSAARGEPLRAAGGDPRHEGGADGVSGEARAQVRGPVTRLLVAACGLGLAAGCLSERPRPAPPVLAIVIDSDTIRSTTPNDTLTGSVRITDPRSEERRVGKDGTR